MRTNTNAVSRRGFLENLTALSAAGIGSSLLLSACGGQSTPNEENESPDDAERQAVEQINRIRREWERAENEGDPSIIDRHGANDIIAMPPGDPPVAGADASKKYMQELFKRFDVEVEYASDEIVVGETLAFDRGTASQRLVPKGGGEPIEDTYSYLWVYRRTPEGWKQTHAIWNSNS